MYYTVYLFEVSVESNLFDCNKDYVINVLVCTVCGSVWSYGQRLVCQKILRTIYVTSRKYFLGLLEFITTGL